MLAWIKSCLSFAFAVFYHFLVVVCFLFCVSIYFLWVDAFLFQKYNLFFSLFYWYNWKPCVCVYVVQLQSVTGIILTITINDIYNISTETVAISWLLLSTRCSSFLTLMYFEIKHFQNTANHIKLTIDSKALFFLPFVHFFFFLFRYTFISAHSFYLFRISRLRRALYWRLRNVAVTSARKKNTEKKRIDTEIELDLVWIKCDHWSSICKQFKQIK